MTLEQMEQRLKAAYENAKIEVIDLTGGGDHYQVMIESKAFQGLSRIERHKAVMKVFDAELQTGEVHALSIQTDVPK